MIVNVIPVNDQWGDYYVLLPWEGTRMRYSRKALVELMAWYGMTWRS